MVYFPIKNKQKIYFIVIRQQRYRVFPGTFFLYIEKAERPKLFARLLRGVFVVDRIAGRFL